MVFGPLAAAGIAAAHRHHPPSTGSARPAQNTSIRRFRLGRRPRSAHSTGEPRQPLGPPLLGVSGCVRLTQGFPRICVAVSCRGGIGPQVSLSGPLSSNHPVAQGWLPLLFFSPQNGLLMFVCSVSGGKRRRRQRVIRVGQTDTTTVHHMILPMGASVILVSRRSRYATLSSSMDTPRASASSVSSVGEIGTDGRTDGRTVGALTGGWVDG